MGDTANSEPSGHEARRHKRATVLWNGVIGLRNRRFDVVVLNLSASGAKIHCAQPLASGDAVTLVVDRFGELDARVVWYRDGTAGLEFLADPKSVALQVVSQLFAPR